MLQDLARTFHLSPMVFYTIAIALLLGAGLVLGFVLNRVIHHWTKKFKEGWGELVFSLLESLPIPLLLLGALYTGLELLTLPRVYERIGAKLLFALVVLVIFYFPAKVVIFFLRRVGRRDPGLQRVTQPAVFLIRALFALLAVIIVLENLGVSLTAVWTTLGVGSVAVALALQETLSNFFAGVYLMADHPISPGDYIKLDSGQEGFVVRLGWRSTSLRTLPGNIVVIPNSALAKAVITNYSLPEPRMAYVLPVSVAYGSDPAKVEKILVEVAREAARDGLEGLLREPAPFVRLIPGFGDSSLDFSLIVQVRQFTDQYLVQSELRKRILTRFEKEGITVPFPTRAVVWDSSALDLLRRPGRKSEP
jgi:small-conductance mechanosensitive channel